MNSMKKAHEKFQQFERLWEGNERGGGGGWEGLIGDFEKNREYWEKWGEIWKEASSEVINEGIQELKQHHREQQQQHHQQQQQQQQQIQDLFSFRPSEIVKWEKGGGEARWVFDDFFLLFFLFIILLSGLLLVCCCCWKACCSGEKRERTKRRRKKRER